MPPQRSVKKKAELLAFGADHVIVTDEDDLAKRVREITDGKGARIIFDPIGGKVLDALADVAADSGIIFEYGYLATEPTPYPLFTALMKNLTVKAYSLFELVANPLEFQERFLEAKQYVYENLANGSFKPIIGRIFPLAKIIDAHSYVESNGQIGKIVVTI